MAGRMMATGWRSGAWSNAEKDIVIEMLEAGEDTHAISARLNRKRKSINDVVRALDEKTRRIYAKKLDEFGCALEGSGRLPAKHDDIEALIKASVQTVEALKADGFSPGHGELNIPSGDNIRRVTRQITGSIGSPGGMCAEMGGELNIGRRFF
jgi:hypothetical protein